MSQILGRLGLAMAALSAATVSSAGSAEAFHAVTRAYEQACAEVAA